MDLTYLLNMLGLGGPGAAVAKGQPGMNYPKGLSTAAPVNPSPPPQDTLADAIGPWQTTVTPAGGAPTPVAAAAPAKTFGDKLSEALSGIGAMESPGIKGPNPSDSLNIARLLLNAAPPSALPSLAAALPRRR